MKFLSFIKKGALLRSFFISSLMLSLILVIHVTGCARPKFLPSSINGQSPSNKADGGETDGDSSRGCDLFLVQAHLCVGLDWITPEPIEASVLSQFKLKFWSPETGSKELGPYVDPEGEVFIKLWMPAHNHGSRPPTVTRNKEGEFQVDNVFFAMMGLWDIRIQIKQNGSVWDQVVLQYSIEK